MWLRPPLLVTHPTEHKDPLGRLWWGDCNVRCSYLYGGFLYSRISVLLPLPGDVVRICIFFRWCGGVELQHCIKSSMCSSHCAVQLCCLCRQTGSFYTVPLLTCLLSIYSMWKLSFIKPRITINTATCIKRLFFTYRGFSESRPVFSLPMGANFR